MKWILDLGHQKTGSKARQKFFANELQRLIGRHAIYPKTGREGNWHRPLYESIVADDHSILTALIEKRRLNHDRTQLAILSYEEMYKLTTAQIRSLKYSLGDTTAVIFLRRQDQLINSFRNQLHKSHRVSLPELEQFEAKMFDYDVAYDHQESLKRWGDAIGYQSVRPILYDKKTSSVSAFFDRLSIPIDLEGYAESRPNPAIDSHGLAVLRWVKRLTPNKIELPKTIQETHRQLAGSFVVNDHEVENYTLSMAERQRIMSIYESSNEWVRQTFFPERHSLFAPIEPGEIIEPDYTEGRQEAEAIIRAARNR